MGPYWRKFGGRVQMDQIMHAADLNYWDLSFLQKHANSNDRNMLCWPSVLGQCRRPGCTCIHEKGVDLPEGFVKRSVVEAQGRRQLGFEHTECIAYRTVE